MENKYNPEEQILRNKAAEQIKEVRKNTREAEKDFEDLRSYKRGLTEYFEVMQGMNHFLAYVKSLSFQKAKLLDIGTGYAKAISELAEDDSLSNNLEIIGTSLIKGNDPNIEVSDNIKLTLTAAETLSTIKDDDIAGITSVLGLGHSQAPELVAKSIDRVLMPSGVLKTAYFEYKSDIETTENHDRFEQSLRDLGFDVARNEEDAFTVDHEPGTHKIVVAIKQPVVGITARQLLSMDSKDYEKQIQTLVEKGFEYPDDDENHSFDVMDDFAELAEFLKRFQI